MTALKNLAVFGIVLILALAYSGRQAEAQDRGAMPTQQNPPPVPQRRVEKKKESFLEWLLRFAGLTATASHQKGDNDDGEGEIYIADLLTNQSSGPLGSGGTYRWPIFLPCDKSVLSLKGDEVVRISWAGEERTLTRARDIVKLVGVNSDNPDEVLVVVAVDARRRAFGSLYLKTGEVIIPTFQDAQTATVDKERQQALDAAEGSERTYGTTTLYVEAQVSAVDRKVQGVDVMLVEAGGGMPTPRNVSRCGNDRCTQPSLSPEGRYVVYIRVPHR